jgi:hypothetical protein
MYYRVEVFALFKFMNTVYRIHVCWTERSLSTSKSQIYSKISTKFIIFKFQQDTESMTKKDLKFRTATNNEGF